MLVTMEEGEPFPHDPGAAERLDSHYLQAVLRLVDHMQRRILACLCYAAFMTVVNKAEPPPVPPVEHIRRLVEADRVREARRYVEERLAEGDTSVSTWARLLRPPEVKTSSYRPRSDFGADNAWLRNNREAFRGRWVALRNGELLDSDCAMRPLVDRLVARGIAEGTLVVQVG